MAALSLAIIGKNNEPLYMKEFKDESLQNDVREEELFGLPPAADGNGSSTGGWDCSIRQQFILHAALDRYEQLAGPAPGCGWRRAGVSGIDAMFLGLLCPVEDMRVYGYLTTTKIMFMIVVDDDAAPPEHQQTVDAEIKVLLSKIHRLYIADTMNPFKEIGSPIVSNRLDRGVQKYVTAFNQIDSIL